MHLRALPSFAAACAAFALSCSSSSSDSAKTTVSAEIKPASATTKVLGKVSLSSTEETLVERPNESDLKVDGDRDLFDWAILEGAAGGTLTPSALPVGYDYQAPSTAGTYHVVITSKRDASAKATSTITVTP